MQSISRKYGKEVESWGNPVLSWHSLVFVAKQTDAWSSQLQQKKAYVMYLCCVSCLSRALGSQISFCPVYKNRRGGEHDELCCLSLALRKNRSLTLLFLYLWPPSPTCSLVPCQVRCPLHSVTKPIEKGRSSVQPAFLYHHASPIRPLPNSKFQNYLVAHACSIKLR